MRLTRFFLLLLALGLAGSARGLAPTSPPAARPVPAPISAGEAERCARQLDMAAKIISQNYFQEIAETKLAAAAALALCRAAGTPPPEELEREPESFFAGRDTIAELTRLRQSLGKHQAFRNDRDTFVGLAAMLELLDRYSVLLSPEAPLLDSVQPNVEVGLTFEERHDPRQPWYIRGVLLGGLADTAGLKPGDAVLAVGEREPPPRGTPEAFARSLMFPAGRSITLKVLSPGEAAPRPVVLSAAADANFFDGIEPLFYGVRRLDKDTWDYWLDPQKKIAYLRCGPLGVDIVRHLIFVLEELKQEGLAGLVLDLRDCPTGVLESASGVAELFLEPNKAIAKVRYGNAATPDALIQREFRQSPREFKSRAVAIVPAKIKVAVLVGPETTGSGEMVAAALQDHRRAVIVGQRSRGKGTVQPVMEEYGLPAFRLSTGLLFRPNGESYHRLPASKPTDPWGVRPDEGYEVRVPAILARQVRRWRHEYERRFADDRRLHPLDSLANDPVLHAALRHFQPAAKPEL